LPSCGRDRKKIQILDKIKAVLGETMETVDRENVKTYPDNNKPSVLFILGFLLDGNFAMRIRVASLHA
jgi:hypothetical protein